MATPVTVTAVIVTFNSEKTIPGALATAKRCHHAGLLDCVVADDDCRNGTVFGLGSGHPRITTDQYR